MKNDIAERYVLLRLDGAANKLEIMSLVMLTPTQVKTMEEETKPPFKVGYIKFSKLQEFVRTFA